MLVTGNLYDCVKNKEVKIFIKKYGTIEIQKDGKVVGYCFGSGTDMFLELDNGETIRFINTKYIESIEIVK